MSTRVRISNLGQSGGKSVVVRILNDHPTISPTPPTMIPPEGEAEFTVTDVQHLKVDEANGLNA